MPAKDGKRLKDRIVEKTETVEEEDWTEEWELVSSVARESNREREILTDLNVSRLLFCFPYAIRSHSSTQDNLKQSTSYFKRK